MIKLARRKEWQMFSYDESRLFLRRIVQMRKVHFYTKKTTVCQESEFQNLSFKAFVEVLVRN